MKLLTHNVLMCMKKTCTENNYPLNITVVSQTVEKSEFDEQVLLRFIDKMDLAALTKACMDLGIYKYHFESLSKEELTSKENMEFLNHVLYEVIVTGGSLACPNCGRIYPIENGIPNMVLNDDEA